MSPAFSAAFAAPIVAPSRFGSFFSVASNAASASLRHAALEQHVAVELARRRGHAGRDRMLLGLVLGIRGRAHGFQRFVVLAFGIEHPGGRDLPLDVDLLGPIGVLRRRAASRAVRRAWRCQPWPRPDCPSGPRRARARNASSHPHRRTCSAGPAAPRRSSSRRVRLRSAPGSRRVRTAQRTGLD